MGLGQNLKSSRESVKQQNCGECFVKDRDRLHLLDETLGLRIFGLPADPASKRGAPSGGWRVAQVCAIHLWHVDVHDEAGAGVRNIALKQSPIEAEPQESQNPEQRNPQPARAARSSCSRDGLTPSRSSGGVLHSCMASLQAGRCASVGQSDFGPISFSAFHDYFSVATKQSGSKTNWRTWIGCPKSPADKFLVPSFACYQNSFICHKDA